MLISEFFYDNDDQTANIRVKAEDGTEEAALLFLLDHKAEIISTTTEEDEFAEIIVSIKKELL